MQKALQSNFKYKFSLIAPLKLSRLVDKKLKQASTYERSRYNEFSQLFMKLYIMEKNQDKNLRKHAKALENQCLMSAKPVQGILEYFQRTSTRFNQKYLVEVFENLVKALRISQQDNSMSFDHSPNDRLFYLPAFDHLIEQFKYGMKQNVFLSWSGMTRIVTCLSEIGYVDAEIVDLLIQKILKRLGTASDTTSKDNQQFRLFQGQKRRYYDKGGFNQVYQEVLENDKFKIAYDLIQQKTLYSKVRDVETKQLQQNITSEQSKKVIKQLLQVINSMNTNLETMIQAIIAIRQQYRRMCKGSSLRTVLSNLQLNQGLLEIEEQLLNIGLIDIQDIKKMHSKVTQSKFNLEDINYISAQDQRKKVQQVLFRLLKNDEMVPAISAFLQNQQFDQTANQIRKNITLQSQNKKIQELSSAWLALVKLANSPYQLKKSTDSVSLLSLQWQKNIMRGNESISQFLPVERIFRKVYAQVHEFLKQNIGINQFACKTFSLSKQIEWIQSLYEIGLYRQASNILKPLIQSQKLIGQFNETFKDHQVYSLANCINYLQDSDQAPSALKWQILSTLKQRLKTRTPQALVHLPNNSLLNIIDFMYLNFEVRTNQQNNAFYSSFVDQLDQRIQNLRFNKHSTSSHQQYNFLVKSFRILGFQRQKEYQFASFQSFYDSFQENQISKYPSNSPYHQIRQSKGSTKFLSQNLRNPYKKAILNTIYQYTNHSQQNSELIVIGFGSAKKQYQKTLKGLYVCDSTESSIEGKNVNGNTRGYLARIKQFYGVEAKAISTNQFLNINYAEQNKIESIKLKDQQSIVDRLKNIYAHSNHDWKVFSNFVNIFVESAQEEISQKSEINAFKVKNIFFLLKEIISLIQSSTMVYQHFLAQRAKIVVILTKCKQQINRQDQFWQSFNKIFIQKYESQNIWEQFDEFIRIFSKNLAVVSFNQPRCIFESKRLSMQVTNSQPSGKLREGAQLELLSYQNWLDSTFAPYNDWNKMLHSKTHFQEIIVDKMSRQNKMLAKAFCPKIKQTMSLIPKFKNASDSKIIAYLDTFHPYNWQSKYSNKNTEQQNAQADSLKQIAETSIESSTTTTPNGGLSKFQKSTIKLLTFSHELKVNKSMKQIYQYINKFQFIENQILPNCLQPTSLRIGKKPMVRRGKAYFSYLESRNEKIYLQSPYMNYILEKMNLVEQVKDLFEKRKDIRTKSKILYQRGQISRQDYKRAVQKIQKQIIEKMEQNIKNKVLDNSEDQMNQASLKMVELEKNLDQFKKLFRRANNYSRWFDEDFIQANGDYERAVKIKRVRAELNLVKFRIINKLLQRTSLSEKQIQFLQKWKNNELLVKQDSHTQKPLKNLSENDINQLQFIHSNLAVDEYLTVNDLVMELDNFINHQALEQVERNLYLFNPKNLSGVPSQLFQFTSNREFTILSYQKQAQIFNQHAKLSDQEVNILINMTSTLKTETPFLRKRFDDLTPKIKSDIQLINGVPSCRHELIAEYVIKVEEQFEGQYKQQHTRQLKQKERERIWRSIFRRSYNEVLAPQIAEKVNILCSRFYLFSKSVPPFFSQLVLMVLQHPQTDQMTKQNLIVNMQVFKIPLAFDSQDIVDIGRYAGSKTSSQGILPNQGTGQGTIMDRLRKSSEKNFAKRVSELL